MKQLVAVFAVLSLVAAVSCNSKVQKKSAASAAKSTVVQTVYDVDSLLSIAESNVNKPVNIRGFVTHTCKHAGKRCFLTGEHKLYSVRVEAKGEIGGFNRELVGSQLLVSGTLKERRLSQAEISNLEADVKERLGKDAGSEETCAAELASISQMQNWMKEHGKDYYATYYVDGLNYEVLD